MVDNHSSASKRKKDSPQRTGFIGNIGTISGNNNPTISGATRVNIIITTYYNNFSLERPGIAPLKPLAGNVARSAGPATRSRKKSNQVQPWTSRLIRIRDINQKLEAIRGNWHIKAWKDRMFYDKPKVDEDKSYFHCFMSDSSGMKIYISFFLGDSQKCEDVYNTIDRSKQDKPVFLSSMRVQKQDRKYKTPQGSYYKLVFNDDSEITRS